VKELTNEELLTLIEETLHALHEHQNRRAQAAAQRIRPDLTEEDLLNPDNFAAVVTDPDFMFEHGQAAGILSAKLALRARLRDLAQ